VLYVPFARSVVSVPSLRPPPTSALFPYTTLFRSQGKILGGVYVGRGQEAIPVGSALLAGPEDMLFPSHRDMAVMLIRGMQPRRIDRKSTRLNSSHDQISYAVFCLKKKRTSIVHFG